MTEQHLRMDEAVKRLEVLVQRVRNHNALLAVLLSEAQVIESELSNLTTLADNWRYVAEKMNGVDPAHPVE